MIQLHDLWLRPIPRWPGPAAWMLLTCLLIGLLPDPADRIGFAIVALIRRDVLDAAVAVLGVVTVNKAIDPGSHREKIPETARWVALVIFHSAGP